MDQIHLNKCTLAAKFLNRDEWMRATDPVGECKLCKHYKENDYTCSQMKTEWISCKDGEVALCINWEEKDGL